MSDQSSHAAVDVPSPKRGRPPKPLGEEGVDKLIAAGYRAPVVMDTTKALNKLDGDFQTLAAQLMDLAGVTRMELIYDRFKVTIERV